MASKRRIKVSRTLFTTLVPFQSSWIFCFFYHDYCHVRLYPLLHSVLPNLLRCHDPVDGREFALVRLPTRTPVHKTRRPLRPQTPRSLSNLHARRLRPLERRQHLVRPPEKPPSPAALHYGPLFAVTCMVAYSDHDFGSAYDLCGAGCVVQV